MTMVSIGDLARSMMLQRHTTATKADVSRLAEALASGRHKDQAARSGGDLSPLAAIESTLARIGSWTSAADSLAGKLGAAQSALGALHGIGEAQAETLLRLNAISRDDQVTLAAREAREHLEAALGVLNTRFAGASVFAGTREDAPAVAGAEVLLDALWPAVSTATNAAEAREAILTWFDDPAGFSAQGYLGGPTQPPIAVAQGETAAVGFTANDPAIRRTLAGLAMAAVIDRGLFPGMAAERRELGQMAGEVLVANSEARVTLAARVGSLEQRLDSVRAHHAAEKTALGIARSGLIAADPYATATELESARVQLETLFAVTARLSGMNLLGYLR